MLDIFINIFNIFLNIIHQILFFAGYHCIHVFSHAQMLCIQAKRGVRLYLNGPVKSDGASGCVLKPDTYNHYLDFYGVKSNDSQNKFFNPNSYISFKEIAHKVYNDFLKEDVRTYFVYNIAKNDNMFNRVLLYNFHGLEWYSDRIVFDPCNHRFLSVQLKLANDPDNVIFDVKMSTNNYSYYILGNRINVDFVRYYCNHVLHLNDSLTKMVDLEGLNLKYTLTIVDGDVNVLKLTEEDELIFGKNAYVLQKYKDPFAQMG